MTSVKSRAHLGALVGCALLAGVINGLLGAGGGIILVFALTLFCKGALPDRRDLYATALVVTLSLTVVSTLLYIKGGNAPPADLSRFVLPAIAGGVAGGLLLGKISSKALGRLFAVLLIVSGAIMILR
ncbi:MAG: TSUP family transporter [Clostridia bacterium]|nr:TSUP family transporter [Clostridia bacterium]